MFKPNYPNQIDNECQLNIFMDYIIHGLIDDAKYPIEFHGVRTSMSDKYSNVVEITIPIKIPKPRLTEFKAKTESRVYEIMKELKYHTYCTINYVIYFEVSYLLPPAKFEVHILSEEEKNMEICLDVKKIIHQKSARGEFFTVVWGDDSQTKVKLAEGDSSDEYTAFLYALGKKVFKDKGEARKFIKEKKKIFEDEKARRIAEKNRYKKMLAMQQSLAHEDFSCIEDEVYGEMFVAPALVSRKVFRRNR